MIDPIDACIRRAKEGRPSDVDQLLDGLWTSYSASATHGVLPAQDENGEAFLALVTPEGVSRIEDDPPSLALCSYWDGEMCWAGIEGKACKCNAPA